VFGFVANEHLVNRVIASDSVAISEAMGSRVLSRVLSPHGLRCILAPGEELMGFLRAQNSIYSLYLNLTMAKFNLEDSDYHEIDHDGKTIQIIKKTTFESFDESILGLGKLDSKSYTTEAISVIFDLEGFTNFCKQIDPHLGVPEYLNDFLAWIFKEIKLALIDITFDEGYYTYADFPFLSKYLGDGILFLWDTENMSDTEIRNVVLSMYEICTNYSENFLPLISKKIISPPSKLRCGIARGAIYSVGDGNDFVGPCINMSARLQKLNSLSFCFSRRGLDPNGFSEAYKNSFLVKKVDIRGIGSEELVCILKSEFEKLNEEDREKFLDV
jgi:class 3 adenylate cyclase